MSHLCIHPTRIRLRKVDDYYQIELRDQQNKRWVIFAVAKKRSDAVVMRRRLIDGIGRKAA